MPLSAERVEPRLSVAIPGSIVSDTPHLREKTGKLGSIARACSIFGVQEIILYPDDFKRDQLGDMQLCAEILSFIETPPYLRKKLFPLSSSLKFTGILPPLQTPYHNVPSSLRESKNGDLREGVVVGRHDGKVVVDVGLERTLEGPAEFPVGKRLTVRLTDATRNLTGEIVDASKTSVYRGSRAPVYWGYKVTKSQSLGRLLREHRSPVSVGTSRYGTPLSELWRPLQKAIQNQPVLLAFGAPQRGLREILQAESINAKEAFDFFVNTVPDQQTVTVRAEEAILVTLGLLNAMRRVT